MPTPLLAHTVGSTSSRIYCMHRWRALRSQCKSGGQNLTPAPATRPRAEGKVPASCAFGRHPQLAAHAATPQAAAITSPTAQQPADTGLDIGGTTTYSPNVAISIAPFTPLPHHVVTGPKITPITTYTAAAPESVLHPHISSDSLGSDDSSAGTVTTVDSGGGIGTVAKMSAHIKRQTTTSVVWREPHVQEDEEQETHSTRSTKVTAKNFQLVHVPVPLIKEGEVLVELVYLSMDSFARSRMCSPANKELVKPLRGLALGLVKQSKAVQLSPGDLVCGFLSWQQLQAVQAICMHAVDLRVLKELGLPASVYLNALGVPGLAAYAALSRIAKPGPEETVFISGAAGAVGLISGQLCKNVYECANVVGSAKTDHKVEVLKAHDYDIAFNYTKMAMADGIAQACPHGIDVYVDNVGGASLQAVLDACKPHARVIACGALQQYGDRPCYGVSNLHHIATKRILLQGLSVIDHLDLRNEFLADMSQYLRQGQVRSVEQVVQGGLTAAGTAFMNLLDGDNIGKMVVQCADDPFQH